jgi:hypothetical protein
VYSRLAEQAGFYDDDEVNQWLWDGVQDAATKLEPLQATATATTVENIAEYDLPITYLTIMAVFYKDSNDQWNELGETRFEDLWHDNPNWETATTGLPNQYYWRGDVIGLTPIPSATYAGANKLRILYSYSPPEFSDDSTTSGLPQWFDPAIISYAVWRCFLKGRDEQRATVARSEYDLDLGTAASMINRHRKKRAPRFEPSQEAYRTYYRSRYNTIFRVVSD